MIWLLLHGCFQWESSDNRHTTSAVQTLGMEGWGGVGRGVVGGNNTEKAFTYIHYVLEGWGSPNLLLLHVRLILSSSLISNLATKSILAPSQWPGVLFLSRKQGNNRVCHKQRWYIAFNLTFGPTRKEEEYTPLKKMLTTVISSYLILQYLESVQTSKRCQSHSFSLLLSKL